MDQIAYTAGLFDGEGCVLLNKQSPRKNGKTTPYYLKISIRSTYKPVIEWLRETYGGSIGASKPYKVTHKPSWEWLLYSNDALRFLQSVRPYLKIKLDEAIIGIEFQAHVSLYKHTEYQRRGSKKGHPVTPPEVISYRENLRQKLNQLRKRSY